MRQAPATTAAVLPQSPPARAPRAGAPRRLRSLACVVLGALMLMSTAFAGGRPSVFFDTDGYWLMGENVTQVIKRLPAVFMGDHKAMTTPVSDDDQIDITIMDARSPVYGFFLYLIDRLGGIWAVAALQALACAWTVFLMWKAAAPDAPGWSYLALMAGLTLGSTLPFFATFVMPDVFAGVAAVGLVLLTAFPDRLTRVERTGLFLLLAFSYAVHTSHMLTALVALAPAVAVLLVCKAPWRGVLGGVALCVGAAALALLCAKLYEGAFAMRTGNALHRPPFLMARTLADGPGRIYLHKVCKGPDKPYIICRFVKAPLNKSDDILWEEKPALGAFNVLKSPDLQLEMEAQEGAFMKGVLLSDPWGQAKASMINWIDQFRRISTHDPLRDPRQFLANPYWKTTRLVDMIPNPRQCKPIGPGCKPPFDMMITKHWHEVVMAVCLLWVIWRLSRPDAIAALADRKDPWSHPAVRLLAAGIILMGIVVLNAGVCGVISGAFSRYQARIAWLVPAAAGMLACGLGLALPQAVRGRVRRRTGRGAAPAQTSS